MKYMDKYGMDNVRGGSFVKVKLDRSTETHLRQMSNGTNNRCFTCGCEGHYAKDCSKYKEYNYGEDSSEYSEASDNYDSSDEYDLQSSDDFEYNIEKWCCSKCNKEFIDYNKCVKHERYCKANKSCFRCGREGHYASVCYASRHTNGKFL